MPRPEYQYNPSVEPVRPTAAPNIQTEVARNDINSNKAFQLAKALGEAQPMIDQFQQQQIHKEQASAAAEARSMSNAELEKRIKEGSMLSFQSPVRMAAMRHVYGENLANNLEMDVLNRAASGEFGTWDDAQKYLMEARKTALQNQDEYTTAGFDKTWGQITNKLQTVQLQTMNRNATEFATGQANARLGATIEKIRSGEIKPEDSANALGQTYRDMVDLKLLANPNTRQAALKGVLTDLSKKGDIELLDGFLSQKLNNGLTIRDVVGLDDAAGYQATAAKIRQQNILIDQAERSVKAAQDLVETAVLNGRFADIPDSVEVMTPSGSTSKFNTKDYAKQIMLRESERLSPSKQVEFWSTSNVENPAAEKKIKSGISNLASVGWTYDGKNVGELNPQGEEAVAEFIKWNKVNQGYAKKLVGSEKDYQMMDDIQFLVERRNMKISDAASVINQMNNSGIGPNDFQIKKSQIDSAVEDVITPHIWNIRPGSMASNIRGWFGGNETVNLMQVGQSIKRRAEILVRTGQIPDVQTAIDEAAKEEAANGMLINNTFYSKKDLPAAPPGDQQMIDKWFERFIKEVPGAEATKQRMDGSKMRLEVGTDGVFTAMIGAVPITDANGRVMKYTREDMEQWMNNTAKQDIENRKDEAAWKSYNERLNKEARALKSKDPYAITKYDSTQDLRWARQEIFSLEAYKKLKAEFGIEALNKKPLTELMELQKKRRFENQPKE